MVTGPGFDGVYDDDTASQELGEAFRSMPYSERKAWYNKVWNAYCKYNNHAAYLRRMYFANPDIPIAVKHESDMYLELREEMYELSAIILGAMYAL